MQDDTTESTDASLSECGHERFERNHYFHGKLMTARDMQAEQAYNVGQRRAHARNVGGSGVAWGLEAEIEDDGDDAILVRVDRGYAVDACGRPVVVPQDREKTITDGSKVDAPALSVYLHYEACLKESVPIDGGGTACEDECGYNRVLEVYDIEVVASDPAASEVMKSVEPVEFPGWDDLSSVSDTDRSQPTEHDEVLSTIAESYRDEAPAPAGAGADEDGLYLGTFKPGDDDAWEPEADRPMQYVYTNDMLYAAIARHSADFANPHETSLRTANVNKPNAAAVSIRDDDSDHPNVFFSSSDGTVDVVHTPTEQRIDFSIKQHVNDVVDRRIKPLERYAAERALKYKALVFDRAAERFDGQAGGTADDIATLAREAVDTRLMPVGESDEEPTIQLNEGEDPVDPENYVAILTKFLSLEEEFRDQVADQVTEESYQRLSNAIGGLKVALEPGDPGTLAIGGAEDDVADAVEWLEELEEEPEPEPADAEFVTDGGAFTEHRGDIAEITVELENTRSATVTIGDPDQGYQATVDVQSGGGDTVTVLMNTYLAGRDADGENRAFGTANPADSATATLDTDVDGVEELDEMLAAETYDLSLAVEDGETDANALQLESRSTDELTVHRGPSGAYGSLTTASRIESALSRGGLEDAPVERGDTVVAEINVNGVFGAIAAASGDATTVDPRAIEPLAHDEQVRFEVRQTGELIRLGKQLRLWQSVKNGAARLLANPGDDRLYLVLDTEQAVFVTRNNERVPLGPGEVYAVQFAVAGETLLADDEETVSDTFEMAGRRQVEVPNIVGDSYTQAQIKAEAVQLSLDPTYKRIQTANTLTRVTYDTIDEQRPEPGTMVDAGSEIQVEVWTSRPIDSIDMLDPADLEKLRNLDIEYVHELERMDTSELTNNLAGVGEQTANEWTKAATDYRLADELSLRENTSFEDALRVSPTFRETGETNLTTLEDSTIETMISSSVDDPTSPITANDAETFLSKSQNLTNVLADNTTDYRTDYVTDNVTDTRVDDDPFF